MSAFGAEPARHADYPVEEVLGIVLPYLIKLKDLGCQTLLDCTTAYFGRDPDLLRRISVKSGMQILTNTGYYAAAQDRYVPSQAWDEEAEAIAAGWVREWTDGIDETGVRSGFIKTAVDEGPLSEIDRKLVRAAILAHKQTGLTIQTHTGNNPNTAREILHMLEAERVHPSAWVWVHAHQLENAAALIDAARLGAWISFDGLSADSAGHILKLLAAMQSEGLLRHVLLSHDGDSYCLGSFRSYDYLLTEFSRSLLENGFSPLEIERMTVTNPMRAFTIKIRQIQETPKLPG
jgi:phosphotriesterase-related protein